MHNSTGKRGKGPLASKQFLPPNYNGVDPSPSKNRSGTARVVPPPSAPNNSILPDYNYNFADFNARIEALEYTLCTKIDTLQCTVSSLIEANRQKDNIISTLQNRLNKLEQYTRKDSFEIREVPVTADESTDAIAIKVAEKAGVDLTEQEIQASHRLKAREGKIPAIIVKLQSRKKRDSIVNNTEVLKTLKKSDVVHLDEMGDGRIYIGDSLSPFYRSLLWKAKQRAQEMGYRYVWFRGEVFARKEKDYPRIKIKNEDDLHLIN